MAQKFTNKQYTYQEFLLECPYKEINLETYAYRSSDIPQDVSVKYNLFDYSDGVVRRSILLSKLDKVVDFEHDLRQFIEKVRWIEELVIINDRPNFENTILQEYSKNTIKAYLYRFNDASVKCFVTSNA